MQENNINKATRAIGIDIGATKIAAALVDSHGTILASARTPTPEDGNQLAVINAVKDMIQGLQPDSACGIGIGVPGVLDPESGIVRISSNLGWKNVAVRNLVQEKLKLNLPVFIQNDVNVDALGEYYFGNGQGSDSLVYLGIGSGIGSGIVLNGELFNGATMLAGEIGHLSLDPEHGRTCGCGGRGCIETFCSGWGILAETQHRLITYNSESVLKSEEISTNRILAAMMDGDPLATAVLEKAADGLGTMLAILAITFNPQTILIGGGFGKAAYDILVPRALAKMERQVLPAAVDSFKIQPARVTSSGVGAACLVFSGLHV